MWILVLILGLLLLALWLIMRHQRRLRRRAYLIQEAVRNGDYQFRLPTTGMLSGERDMAEALNRFGEVILQERRKTEVATWERLTRVLTHEIMNGMAPIVSLSQTLLRREEVKGTPTEEGLRAIQQTSGHLSVFLSAYRTFSKELKPKLQPTRISEVLTAVKALFPQLEWSDGVDAGFTVQADPDLFHQVMLNLTKNAAEAGAHRIALCTVTDRDGRISLLVSNDGPAILAENRSSVFVPFFTTKPEGSGIGLALCRKIMIAMNGDLELLDNSETTFKVTF